jgi:hypothetical protein
MKISWIAFFLTALNKMASKNCHEITKNCWFLLTVKFIRQFLFANLKSKYKKLQILKCPKFLNSAVAYLLLGSFTCIHLVNPFERKSYL